jgi:polyisoprenoid-binding protein YceI
MEEHFNENYAESNKFLKANFQGEIENFSSENNTGNFEINGNLTFHGITKTIENIPITIDKIGNKITIKGSFRVLASDFKIEIPKIVKNKIAEDVNVSFSFELLPK